MDITSIDKNFQLETIKETNVVWKNARDDAFSLHGVFYSEEEGKYRRVPKAVADTVSDGVAYLSTCTAGGRLRFTTDSDYVAVKVLIPVFVPMRHMTFSGTAGFSLYENGKFIGIYSLESSHFSKQRDGKIAYEGILYFRTQGQKEVELYFPLYNGVLELFIGLKEGAAVQPMPYANGSKPIVFYGSSITQGGCASRPGNDYISYLSRWLNMDIINLGFSGNGKGEKEIRDYIAGLDVSAFVMDYDHNSPTPTTLEETHYPLYQAFRNTHKDVPILFITKPDFDNDPTEPIRRAVIEKNYYRALEEGDTRVGYIDGETLFQKEDRDACTVDNCHPNDLGFYRMAQTIYPVLSELLKKAKA